MIKKTIFCRLVLLYFLAFLGNPAFSQIYTISPSGWISAPTSNITSGSTTLHGNLLELKALIEGTSLSFNLRKSDGSIFQNPITVQVRKNSATGSILQTKEYGGGYLLIAHGYGTPAAGTYVIVIKSKGATDIWYYTKPVTITVQEQQQETPTVITKDASNVTAAEATLRGQVYPNGSQTTYYFKYGTSRSSLNYSTGRSTISNTDGSYTINKNVTNLSPSTTYYFRAVAYNSAGEEEGDIKSFTTESAGNENHAPVKPYSPSPSNGATNQPTQVTLSWSCYDEDGDDIRYNVYIGTSPSNMSHLISTHQTSQSFTAEAGKTYYWYVEARDDFEETTGNTWSFSTKASSGGNCTFPDLPNTNDYYDATCYLYSLGVLSGVDSNGSMQAEKELTRAHLAKIAFRGVYSIKSRQVPSSVPSDNYPTVYSDLKDNSTYYYQAARALLYLEYGDGVTPFDRDQTQFNPSGSIKRMHVVKVLLETFNIKPNLTGTNNPFSSDADMVSLASSNPLMMGYMRKAASLGIISKGRPYDNCLRGEAFTMLARIMQKVESGSIADPNPGTGDYFQPLNITLSTISMGLGLPLGNFQHYTKTSFSLSGTVPLTFGHTYNSYNTTLPEAFYGVNDNGETYQPLGDGWSHNYHTFISVPGGLDGTNTRLLVHWGGGKMDVYKPSGSTFVPESYGVYDEFSFEGSELVIKTKSQVEYHFSSQGGSNGAYIFYLSSVKDRNGNTLTLNYESGVNGIMRIKSVTDGHRSLTFSYTKAGTNLLTKVSDPIGRSIQFSYQPNPATGRYRLSSFTDAKGQTTRYTYGDGSKLSTSRLLEKIQLPKGNYIENEYDARRRLSRTVSGVNGVPTTQTDVTVNATYGSSISTSSSIVVSRGSKSSTYNYTFNGNNAMTKLTGNQNLSVTRTYGNSSHPELPTAVTSNSTNISNVTYDAKGNITKFTVTGDGTLTTTMTYDGMNNLTSVTDPKGYTTTYTYDSKGNLTGVSAPEGVTASITVNSKGLPTEVTNPMGVKTQFQYNTYGNVTKTTLPALSLSSTAAYDNASRMTSSTDAMGRTTSFSYDGNDNLTSMTDPASHTTSFDFDQNDNMTSITNAKGGVTSMSYDNATDWLTSVSFAGATKEYEYNDDGTLDTYTKPDGTTLSCSYDNLGRMTSNGINSFSYDSKMRLSSITGGGMTLSFTYDGFNRITGTSCGGHSNSYTYD